ncbi:MAG: hypothetical protein U0Z44_04985 [Kouleothrix sp.]
MACGCGWRHWPSAASSSRCIAGRAPFAKRPKAFRERYAGEQAKLKHDVATARAILPQVVVPPEAEEFALGCIRPSTSSHRAEIALLEAARARAAADNRLVVTHDDIRNDRAAGAAPTTKPAARVVCRTDRG